MSEQKRESGEREKTIKSLKTGIFCFILIHFPTIRKLFISAMIWLSIAVQNEFKVWC